MRQILKVLVGSYAHELATSTSDTDYRGVFITPTEEFLKLGQAPLKTSWNEGTEDDISYELGYFLHLATHSNPSILEVFVAPVVESVPLGDELRKLFPHVWSSRRVYDAFLGYSMNQQKKMLSDKSEYRDRHWKYAVAYVRVLLQGIHLLKTGELLVKVNPVWRSRLANIKAGEWSQGEIIDKVNTLKGLLTKAYEANPNKETDLESVNDFLLGVRKEYWRDRGNG